MYRVSFVTDPDHPNYGKIVFDKPSYEAGDPDNNIDVLILSTPAGIPETVPSFTSSTSASIDIPVDANGNFQYGNYEVRFTEGGEDFIIEDNFVCRDKVNYPFSIKEDCVLSRVVFIDGGEYKTNATTTRIFRLRRTSLPVFNAPARDDSYTRINEPEFPVAIGYAGVNYSFSFTGTTEWAASSDIEFREIFASRSLTQLVSCPKTVCDMAECVDDYIQGIRNAALACGRPLSAVQLDNINGVYNKFFQLLAYLHCGDSSKATRAYAYLEGLVGSCDCGCDDNTPRKLVAAAGVNIPDSSSDSSTLIVSTDETGALDVEVLSNERKVTITGLLRTLYDSIIDRTGGNVDVALTPPDWIKVTGSALQSTWDNWSDSGVAYRLRPSDGGAVEIRAALKSSSGLAVGSYNVLASSLPAMYWPSTQTIAVPVVRLDGRVSGTAVVTNTGQIRVTISFAYEDDIALGEYDYQFAMRYYPGVDEVFDYTNATENL